MSIDAETLQRRLLGILKQFHSICVENHLRYYIIGGTCIGAARHQGFIPWDDDIDVGMPREDYEIFCGLSSNNFPSNLELRFYRNTPDSPFQFAKLVDNTTTLIERAYLDYVEGLYLDVFPLDGARNYNNSISERIRCNRIWFEKGMIYYHHMTQSKSNLAKKILIYIAKHSNARKMHDRVEKHMMKYAFDESDYTANFFGAWKEKEIYPRKYLGTPQLYKFEDTELYGPEDIHEYLTHVYGDYMKLPPEEKRVFKHNYHYLDINHGFHDYCGHDAEDLI